MKRSKATALFLLLTLASLLQVISVHAQTEQPPMPGIAFLGSLEGEITVYENELPYTLHVVNQSTGKLALQVSLLGLEDILQTDQPTASVSLEPGAIWSVRFFPRSKSLDKTYSGLIVFSSERGDVIYKTMTIRKGERPSTEVTAQKDQISLINTIDNINWNELQNKKIDLFFLNQEQDKADFTGTLYVMWKDLNFKKIECGRLTLDPSSAGILQCDPGKLFLPSDRGSYSGFIIIQDSGNKWVQHFDFILHVPSSEAQVLNGPKLEFLNGEDPIVIDYNLLPIQLGLINKGLESVDIQQVEVLLPNIIDQSGYPISSLLEVEQNRASTIASLKTAWLELKRTPSTKTQPRDGNYAGYLIVKTNNDQAIIVKAITLQVSAIDTTLPTVTEKIATNVQLWFQKLFRSKVRFATTEWVIVSVFFVWLFFWLISKLTQWWWAARGKVGPITIEEIANKPTLASTMRYHLARCGVLPNTSTPNTSTGFAGLTTVISESKLPEAKFVTAILNFIQAFLSLSKKQGYTVTCTPSGDEAKPPVSLTTEIKMSRSGQAKRIFTLTGNTYEEVGKNAAFYIFHYASGRSAAIRHIPKWSRFSSPVSYQKYKEATELTSAGKYEDAVKQFAEAAQDAPFNASLRMGWGDAYEMQKKDTDALGVYLEAALMWPELYGFWYRIAAKLGCINSTEIEKYKALLYNLIQGNSKALERANHMLEETDRVEGLKSTSLDKTDPVKLSLLFLKFLETEITFARMIGNWSMAAWLNLVYSIIDPGKVRHRLARYYWNYIPLFPWGNGAQFQRMVQLGYLCIKQQAEKSAIDDKQVRQIMEYPWNQWQVYYNAACFYALRYVKSKSEKDAADALMHLKTAAQNPHSGLDMKWVQKDQDLDSLHENPEFKALFDIESREEIKDKETKGKKDLYQGISLIQQVATQQKEDWETPPGRKVSPEELIIEADHQTRVWECLFKLCDNPTDAKLLGLFWSIGMQNNANIQPNPNSTPPDSLKLDKLDLCWKDIRNNVQSYLDLWNSRKQDARLYLEHGKPQMRDVWKLWSKTEIRQWEYLVKLIEHHMAP